MDKKELILDYSKWKCGGGDYSNGLGEGPTALLNENGYMCCLGQFSLQLNPEIKESDILNFGAPHEISKEIPDLVIKDEQGNFEDESLSHTAMYINDNIFTTPIEKIEKLQTLFGKSGYTIKVINKPE